MGTPASTPGRQCLSISPAQSHSQVRPGRSHHLGPIGTNLVNPELAHDDVVNSGGDFPPDIVIPTGVELEVDGTCRERAGLWAPPQHHAGPQSQPSPSTCISHHSSLPLLHAPCSAAGRDLHSLCPLPNTPKPLISKAGQKGAAWLTRSVKTTSTQPRDRQKTNRTLEGGSLSHLAAREGVKAGSKTTWASRAFPKHLCYGTSSKQRSPFAADTLISRADELAPGSLSSGAPILAPRVEFTEPWVSPRHRQAALTFRYCMSSAGIKASPKPPRVTYPVA